MLAGVRVTTAQFGRKLWKKLFGPPDEIFRVSKTAIIILNVMRLFFIVAVQLVKIFFKLCHAEPSNIRLTRFNI